ncbi:hypothetical protein CWN94_21660 [Vibrio splendidus]|uniref:helix-turn-helix domain-containing protein n=1 Tax=Vibrio splendidus TaxID=29497 RepID=UPI000D3CA5D6|nr:helix-turn-helix domain-containing protein [Vibrio splendidus]PTO51371.1 hypothetical protein CWN94_21660 [Vibrio splendidus]
MQPSLHQLIKSVSNSRLRLRLLAISYFVDGKNRTEIAKLLNVSRLSVNRWVKLYLDSGVDGLVEKPRVGRSSYLTLEQKKRLKEHITQNLITPKGKRLQGSDIAEYILKEFNVFYSLSSVYRVLSEMGINKHGNKNGVWSEECNSRDKV